MGPSSSHSGVQQTSLTSAYRGHMGLGKELLDSRLPASERLSWALLFSSVSWT